MTEIEVLKRRVFLKKQIIQDITRNSEDTIEELRAHIRALENQIRNLDEDQNAKGSPALQAKV